MNQTSSEEGGRVWREGVEGGEGGEGPRHLVGAVRSVLGSAQV